MKRYGRQVSLSGSWKFRTDPDGMGDRYPDDAVAAYKEDCQFFDAGYDDRDWGEIAVPACWQAEGHDYNGAAWYRLRFDHRPGAGENVARLSFLGVDYFADVWLNGYFLGSHEGFFNHFEFDASPWIRAGENLLVVKVDSPNDTNLKVRPIDKTIVKGALDDWDCNDLTVNPGGIFADVRLLLSTDVYLGRMKATPLVDAADGSARVMCRVEAVNTTGRFLTVSLAAALEPANFTGRATRVERELVLPPGPSELDLWIDVAEPRLWWPWDLGEQHLYSLDLSVREGERTLDRLSDRIGLRQVRTEPGSSAIHVNGTRVFCRGPNYVSEQLQSNMTRDKSDRRRHDARGQHEHGARLLRGGKRGVLRRPTSTASWSTRTSPADEQLQRPAVGAAHATWSISSTITPPSCCGASAPSRGSGTSEGGHGDGGRGAPRGSLPVRAAGRERVGVEADRQVRLADRLPLLPAGSRRSSSMRRFTRARCWNCRPRSARPAPRWRN